MSLTVFHGWKDLPPEAKGAAVALGNFDGVHRGHQQVLADAAKAARALGAPLGAISFEPHPRLHFAPEQPPFRLMTANQLARTLDSLGVERLYLLPFGTEMAEFSDREFVDEVLVAGLGARHVAVGFDITFGKGRTGDPQSMKTYAGNRFTVSVAERLALPDGVKISSTEARAALQAGRPQDAAQILGRPFAIEGMVQKGRQLGRTLGIPTANVALGDYVSPAHGVYATRTRLPDGREIEGVSNIGENPTTGKVEARLEVWLFDFDEDIYGEVIETDLVAFLRPEQTFIDADGNFDIPGMVEQIHRDAAQARAILLPE